MLNLADKDFKAYIIKLISKMKGKYDKNEYKDWKS